MDIARQLMLRRALVANTIALLGAGGLMGAMVKQIDRDALPPYLAHVLVTNRGGGGQATLTPTDRAHIQSIRGVMRLHSQRTYRTVVTMHRADGDTSVPATVHEASEAWPVLAGFRAISGRMWSAGEVTAGAPVAMLEGQWPAPVASIALDGQVVRVVGVVVGPALQSRAERAVWVPVRPTTVNSATRYLIEVSRSKESDLRVASEVIKWVTDHRGLTPSGQLPVAVTTFVWLRADVAMVRRVLYGAVVAFFAIPSIFVGSGIASVTRLAVHQRTPEIGIRRAVGATRQQVLDLFVREALMLAWGATWRAALLAAAGFATCHAVGIALNPPLPLVLLGLSLPSVVAFASSVPPAVAAAELPPAVALTVR